MYNVSVRKIELCRIILNEKTPEQTIFLKDVEGTGKVIPVVIGIFEANAIQMGLYKIPTERPMTHELIYNILKSLDGTIERIEITRLDKGTFFADIHVRTPNGIKKIDSRPSDAIALATRYSIPIFVSELVFNKAAVNDIPLPDSEDDEFLT